MIADPDELRKRVGAADEAVRIVLKKGDTFWSLAGCKYGGIHPIDAIYAANKLAPSYVEVDGMQRLVDPIYYAGKEYTLPSIQEVPALKADFWKNFDPRSIKERVGEANQRTAVCIRWDETIHELSALKYNGRSPSKAIFEINALSPTVHVIDGAKQVLDPIYQAGWSYIFPAEDEIAELERRYESRINSLIV